MNWLTRTALWVALKSSTANPQKWFIDWVNGGEGAKSSAGIVVSPESAQRSATVFACVQARSQDIAKLPLILYRKRSDGGRERATDHPLFKLLSLRPNSRQTSTEWREMMQAHLDLRGNCYSLIERDKRFRPVELTPLHPDWVTVMRSDDGTPFYEVRMFGTGEKKRYAATDVLHIKDRSDDGYIGKSCISRARDVIGLDLGQSQHAAQLFANGASLGGYIKHPAKIGEAGRELLLEEFNKKFGNKNGKAHSTALLAEGMEYVQVGMTNRDADFIEGRKLSRQEVAAIFRVPPHKVGIMDNATFSNIEHQSLEYVIDTLMPTARRWEQGLAVALLRESEQEEYYFEFLFDALLRGDFATRMAGYATGRQWGLFSADDCREKENMNPLPDGKGEEYLRPSNMTLAGAPIPDPNKVPAASPASPAKDFDMGDTKVVRLGVS